MNTLMAFTAACGLAGSAMAQDFEIFLVAPDEVFSAYTVEVWGQVAGPGWFDGTSAVAGFGIDIIATQGGGLVSSVTTAHNSGGGITLSDAGFPPGGGPDLLGVRGGQLANLFGFLNPNIDLSNPILLFTFDVTLTSEFGIVEYTPSNPPPTGGLSFYPDSTQGTSVIAPNDPGTTLTLTGVRTLVNTPAAGPLALIAMAGMCPRLRRRAT